MVRDFQPRPNLESIKEPSPMWRHIGFEYDFRTAQAALIPGEILYVHYDDEDGIPVINRILCQKDLDAVFEESGAYFGPIRRRLQLYAYNTLP